MRARSHGGSLVGMAATFVIIHRSERLALVVRKGGVMRVNGTEHRHLGFVLPVFHAAPHDNQFLRVPSGGKRTPVRQELAVIAGGVIDTEHGEAPLAVKEYLADLTPCAMHLVGAARNRSSFPDGRTNA